jgi:hypothetical protein
VQDVYLDRSAWLAATRWRALRAETGAGAADRASSPMHSQAHLIPAEPEEAMHLVRGTPARGRDNKKGPDLAKKC